MTQVGRLNIDVVARTGQFAAEMKRVRAMMRDTAKAGSLGGRLGGMGGGGFGIAGGLMGLSGPMLALSAAIAALGKIVELQRDVAQRGRTGLQEAIELELRPEQQAATAAAARVMRPDGTSKDVLSMTRAFADKDNRLELRQAGMSSREIDALNAMDLGDRLEEMRRLAMSGRGGAIATALGSEAGADFLQLRGVLDDGLLAKAVEGGMKSGLEAFAKAAGLEAQRQRIAAERDPHAGFIESAPGAIADFLRSFVRGENLGGLGQFGAIGAVASVLDRIFNNGREQVEQLQKLPSAEI